MPATGLPDEVLHFVAYAVLGAALAHARFHGAPRASHALMVAAGLAYGATDEWHQSFVAGRDPALGDWVADALGVTVGYAVSWAVASALVGSGRLESKG